MSKPFESIREHIASTAFAGGMLSHVDSLPQAPFRQYIDGFLPSVVQASGYPPETMAADLADLTVEILREQILYNRRGADAMASVDFQDYEDPEVMDRRYLNGLALALVFWPNHFSLLRFFEASLLSMPLGASGRALDLGCGHGLFSALFGRRFPGWDVTALDISSFATGRAERLWSAMGNEGQLTAVTEDIGNWLDQQRDPLDVILFSELVEHLEDGPAVLARLGQCLAPDGVMFFTTALNAAFIDHRLFFHELAEVHQMIDDANLAILRLDTHFVADTKQGPQEDIFGLLVPKRSPWLGRMHKPAPGTVHHVGVLCSRIERAIEHHTARGAELVYGPVLDIGMDCRVAFLRQPGLAELIELVEPFSKDSPLKPRLRGNRIDHLCYEVADLQVEIDRRVQLGDRLVYGPVQATAMRRRVAFLMDREGLYTELVETSGDHPWFV